MKQKKLSLGARFGLAVASFLLGILLFFSAIATTLIADVRTVTAKDNIRDFVREVFVEFMSGPVRIQAKAPVTSGTGSLRVAPVASRAYGALRREEPSGVAASLTDQLIGMFYEEVGEQIGTEMPVSKEEFTQMINESTVKDYIADKTADLIADYVVGEVTTTFEPEEIVTLIEENAQLIETITGEPLPDDIAQQVATVFKENEIVQKVEAEGLAGFMEATGSSIPGLPSDSENESQTGDSAAGGSLDAALSGDLSSIDLNEIMDALRTATSTSNLIWGIVICLVLIAAIILVNIRQISKGLRRAGYPLLLAGLGIVPCLLAHFSPDLWTVLPGLTLVQKILRQVTVVYAVVFGTGLALVIGGIVLGIVLRVKSKSPVTIPSSPETEVLAAALVDETPVEVSCETAEESYEEEPAAEGTEDETAEGSAAEDTVPVGE